MTTKFWHDLEKTIPATEGMTVAVVECAGVIDGKPVDAVEKDPSRRPRVGLFGNLEFHGQVIRTSITFQNGRVFYGNEQSTNRD